MAGASTQDGSPAAPADEGRLRTALIGFCSLAVVACLIWAAADPPPSAGVKRAAPHQRLTPIDAPRFKAGHWVDAEDLPLGEGKRGRAQ
jgi:hypothetical protein